MTAKRYERTNSSTSLVRVRIDESGWGDMEVWTKATRRTLLDTAEYLENVFDSKPANQLTVQGRNKDLLVILPRFSSRRLA